MDIIKLYKDILSDAALLVDDKGMVSIDYSRFGAKDEKTPILIDGKRLVLPTFEQLSEGSQDKIFFHPLHENLLRGESVVITKLRGLLSTRLNFTIGILVQHMLDICASVNKHKYLNPDQAAVLSIAPNCDELTCKNFASILVKTFETDNKFISFYLKRAGVVNGVKYARAGIISFPVFEEIAKQSGEVYGIKLRKKDYESIINIFKYILKDIDKAEKYNRGSDSDIAPFMDALMKTFLAVSSELNDIINCYKDFDKDADLSSLEFNPDWQDAFIDLSVIAREIKKIPPQPGNEGESRKVDAPVPNSALAPLNFTPGTANVERPVQQPVQNTAPVKSSGGSVPFDQLMRQNNQQPVQTPFNQGFVNPQMYPNQMPPFQNSGFQAPRSPLDVLNAQAQMQNQMGYNPAYGFNNNMPQMNQQWRPGQPRSRGSLPQQNFAPTIGNGNGNRFGF